MSPVIRIHPAEDFKERSRSVLNDPGQRKNFRGAMDFLQAKRSAQFPDHDERESLRDLGAHIRRYSLAHLPQLLEQLEANLTANGVQVHWAQNGEEANAIALGIARRADAKRIIKGKSMVSEEIEFNHAMEAAGVEAFESDMGEYIVQLADEKPSHIIMPAIHKTKQEIAKLFAEKIPGVDYTEDVDALIQIGRQVLRRKFAQADIGLSGVNFCIAETGTLCLVENEGNGRMCTTVPRIHIAMTGIEKVVQKLEHVPPLLSLLTRSATGQSITTYVNLISGPRKPDEKDGPKEVHLILLDNGRTQAYADEQLRANFAVHPLWGLHEPLPGLRAHWRPCLRHHLPRPDWRHHLAAYVGAGVHLPAGLCVHPLWCLWRGVSGQDSHTRSAGAPAQRGAGPPRQFRGHFARQWHGPHRADQSDLAFLVPDIQPAGYVPHHLVVYEPGPRPVAHRAGCLDPQPNPPYSRPQTFA